MNVRQYFDLLGKDKIFTQATFIIARAVKDNHSPSYHAEYRTTPIYTVEEWLNNAKILDYIVLNDKQAPIDWLSGAPWINWYNGGHLLSLLVIPRDELETLYSQDQARSMEEYIERKIREEVLL